MEEREVKGGETEVMEGEAVMKRWEEVTVKREEGEEKEEDVHMFSFPLTSFEYTTTYNDLKRFALW